MPAKAVTGSKRVQVRLSGELLSQVEALSKASGVPVSHCIGLLVAFGLKDVRGIMPTDIEALARADRAMREDSLPNEPRAIDDRPGFRPGGKPRSDVELLPVGSPRGEEWQGYMRGL